MPKISSNEIYQQLKSVTDTEENLLVLHSSLLNFKAQEEDIKWALLDALQRLVDDGYTIALPAFTFSFTKNGKFDLHESTPEVGVLANWAQNLLCAKRTRHPIYSFIVMGEMANDIAACKNTTTFGEDSCFSFFDKYNARIIMFGCDWFYCTQFHYYEEEAKVPYREYKDFTGKLTGYGKSAEDISATMYVRSVECEAINDFSNVVSVLSKKDLVKSTCIQELIIESVNCASLGEVCRELLISNQFAFIKNESQVRYKLERQQESARLAAINVAILGSVNNATLTEAMHDSLDGNFLNKTDVYMPDYGQTYNEVLNQKSGLYRSNAKYSFFVDRLEDVLQINDLHDYESEKIELVKNYIEIIRMYASKVEGYIFVNDFFSQSARMANVFHQIDDTNSFVKECNDLLKNKLQDIDNIQIIDMSKVILGFEDKKIHDSRLWFIGKIPYSSEFFRHLTDKFMSIILSHEGKAIRALAIDLDNTLWGGVLGEDGKASLQVGGDYPGNVYKYFQKVLLYLSQQHGIALMLLSKNDEVEALDAVNTLPDMLLNEETVVSHAINWNEKWRNLIKLSESIGLGLENIGFIDDNPVERASMRKHLPEVKVIDLPEDPALFIEALMSNLYLSAALYSNNEDKSRHEKYKIRKNLQSERNNYESIESFYASLGMDVYINELNEENIARAAQLVSKTNQFNTTTMRYTQKEIKTIADKGDGIVLVVGLKDKYSEYENIGLLVCNTIHDEERVLEIDLFLMSCRVLGRGIETGVLYWLVTWARSNSIDKLKGKVIESKRNEPVRDVFARHGFTQSGSENWVFDCNSQNMESPYWVNLIDQTVGSYHV